MFWVMWITIPKRVVMKDPKKDNIHHFADEFAFEDLKHESGGEGAHHAKSYPTKDSQISMIMKQISHLNTRIERLEKILEENSWHSLLYLHWCTKYQDKYLILSLCYVYLVLKHLSNLYWTTHWKSLSRWIRWAHFSLNTIELGLWIGNLLLLNHCCKWIQWLW